MKKKNSFSFDGNDQIVWNYTPTTNSWFGTFKEKHVAEIHYDPYYEVYGLFDFKTEDDVLFSTLLEAQAEATKIFCILNK